MKYIFSSLIICWVLTGNLYSQGIYIIIDTIKTIPANPTTNISIKIVSIIRTTSQGTKLSFNFTKQADTFNLVGCFFPGIAASPKTFYDTINIGTLIAGTYYVNYIGESSSSPTSCNVFDIISKATSFQVIEANGIKNAKCYNNHFYIYPNPTTNLLSIKPDETLTNCQLELINCLGQAFLSISLIQETTIDMTTFAEGVYVISITNGNNKFFHKVIKQ